MRNNTLQRADGHTDEGVALMWALLKFQDFYQPDRRPTLERYGRRAQELAEDLMWLLLNDGRCGLDCDCGYQRDGRNVCRHSS